MYAGWASRPFFLVGGGRAGCSRAADWLVCPWLLAGWDFLSLLGSFSGSPELLIKGDGAAFLVRGEAGRGDLEGGGGAEGVGSKGVGEDVQAGVAWVGGLTRLLEDV